MRRLLRQILAVKRALFIVFEDVAETTVCATSIFNLPRDRVLFLGVAVERVRHGG
jgi:hypothetical protein